MLQEFFMQPTFAVGVLAFFGSFAAIYVKNGLDRRERQRALAIMLSSEIQTILDLIASNSYVDAIQDCVNRLAAGEVAAITFRVTRSYTRIFDANLGDLGLLRECVLDIVSFYAQVNSLLEVKEQIELTPQDETNRDRLLASHKLMIEKFRVINEHGRAATKALAILAR